MDRFKKRFAKIVNGNKYLTLASASLGGKSWITPLYFAYDQSGKFYWYSRRSSWHSRLIERNPEVAISIFDSRLTGDDVDALYFRARAREVVHKDLSRAVEFYCRKCVRDGFNISPVPADFTGKSPVRMYEARVSRSWLVGKLAMYKDKFLDSRVEIKRK